MISDAPTPPPKTPRDLGAALARAEQAVASGMTLYLGGPPPEVQREMVRAEQARRNLAAQGREVRFRTRSDGRVSVELTDRSGHSLDQIGAAGLFALLNHAAG